MKREEIKKKNKATKKDEVAIKVENLSKAFRVPHEKNTSIKGAALNMFRRKNYETFEALKDINFEVKKGEFFGIIGRNGSGKSTLLKILAGIYVPDTGRVVINGKLSPFLELGVGFNPELTGRENLFLGGAILGLTRKEVEAKYDSIVAFAELEEFIDMKLKNYSSGMQVRLAFSLAINAHAEILLMDEVLAVGDTNFQAKCLTKFNEYREAGKTVILVTHDVAVVQKYCDRVVLLRNGKIAKIGKADEVSDEYTTQNILDEEKRLRLSEGSNSRLANRGKTAEITKVDFLDETGKSKNVFVTGEPLDIRIYYKIYRSVPKINIGIGIHAFSGGNVIGYNTQMDEYNIAPKSGHITLHFDKLLVLKGEYFMNVVCFGDNEVNYYDFKPKEKILKIYSVGKSGKYKGFLDIPHSWKETITNEK